MCQVNGATHCHINSNGVTQNYHRVVSSITKGLNYWMFIDPSDYHEHILTYFIWIWHATWTKWYKNTSKSSKLSLTKRLDMQFHLVIWNHKMKSTFRRTISSHYFMRWNPKFSERLDMKISHHDLIFFKYNNWATSLYFVKRISSFYLYTIFISCVNKILIHIITLINL